MNRSQREGSREKNYKQSTLFQSVLYTVPVRKVEYESFSELNQRQIFSVQKVVSALHWTNHFPKDNANSFLYAYLLDRDVEPVNNWGQLNHYPLKNAIGFLDS